MANNTSLIEIEKFFSIEGLQNIVDSVSSLIGYNIVIANRHGFIIAATRRSRIGVFNPDVKEMIENNWENHVVYNEKDGKGFLPGINMPICFEGNAIASVGITGNPDEVKIFCKLIQSLVQQQIVDLVREKESGNRRQILNSFVYDWIFQTAYLDADEFRIRAGSLGINIAVPRSMAIARAVSNNPADNADDFLILLQQSIASQLRALDKQHFVTLLGNEVVVLLNTDDPSQAAELMTHVQKNVQETFHTQLFIGIGMPFSSREKARLSYETAKLACKTAEESHHKTICSFNTYDFRLLISSISKTIRQQVFNSVYRNFTSDDQVKSNIQLLKSYVENNRSISQTADELFLHKNTVQAQLNRIHERTGYNPRESKDLCLLYATTYMYEMGIRLENSNASEKSSGNIHN